MLLVSFSLVVVFVVREVQNVIQAIVLVRLYTVFVSSEYAVVVEMRGCLMDTGHHGGGGESETPSS